MDDNVLKLVPADVVANEAAVRVLEEWAAMAKERDFVGLALVAVDRHGDATTESTFTTAPNSLIGALALLQTKLLLSRIDQHKGVPDAH